MEALLLIKNLIFHERIKYIIIKYYYIRDLIIKDIIDFNYIFFKNQKANGLTKPLNKSLFNDFLIHINFKNS